MKKRCTVVCGVVLVVFLLCTPAWSQSDSKDVRKVQITSMPAKTAAVVGSEARISAIKGNEVTIHTPTDARRMATIQVRDASMLRVGDRVTISGNVLTAIRMQTGIRSGSPTAMGGPVQAAGGSAAAVGLSQVGSRTPQIPGSAGAAGPSAIGGLGPQVTVPGSAVTDQSETGGPAPRVSRPGETTVGTSQMGSGRATQVLSGRSPQVAHPGSQKMVDSIGGSGGYTGVGSDKSKDKDKPQKPQDDKDSEGSGGSSNDKDSTSDGKNDSHDSSPKDVDFGYPDPTRSARITYAGSKNLTSIVGNQARVTSVRQNQITLQNLNDGSRRTTVQVDNAASFKVGQTVSINGNTLTPHTSVRSSESTGKVTIRGSGGGRGPGPDPAPVRQMR